MEKPIVIYTDHIMNRTLCYNFAKGCDSVLCHVNNFKEFDLIPNAEIKELLNQLNISHFTMDGTVINEEIIINSLDVFEEDELNREVKKKNFHIQKNLVRNSALSEP